MNRTRKDPWETVRRLLFYLVLFLGLEGPILYWKLMWNKIAVNPDTSYMLLLIWICVLVFLWRTEDAAVDRPDQ